jgi:hypothetical protein
MKVAATTANKQNQSRAVANNVSQKNNRGRSLEGACQEKNTSPRIFYFLSNAQTKPTRPFTPLHPLFRTFGLKPSHFAPDAHRVQGDPEVTSVTPGNPVAPEIFRFHIMSI